MIINAIALVLLGPKVMEIINANVVGINASIAQGKLIMNIYVILVILAIIRRKTIRQILENLLNAIKILKDTIQMKVILYIENAIIHAKPVKRKVIVLIITVQNVKQILLACSVIMYMQKQLRCLKQKQLKWLKQKQLRCLTWKQLMFWKRFIQLNL